MAFFNNGCFALPIFMFFFFIFNNSVESSHKVYVHLQSVPAFNVTQVHRTGFHFQPEKHWINDPNGPMQYKGIYHLFYQYNPKGAVWGNIVWAHSVSKDMINWEGLEHAIFPSKSFDQYGCWSGSATILPGDEPVILYTGIIDPNNTQVQNYAVPEDCNDPYLRKWNKPDNNPLIVADGPVNKSAFRDPTTAWFGSDGMWRTLVGGRSGDEGVAYLYRSRDFMTWQRAEHPLHSAPKTGMWECPDFYPVSKDGKFGLDTSTVGTSVKHVLKNSFDVTRYEYYTIGNYDAQSDKFTPDDPSLDGWNGLRYDYGNFYASKTFYDQPKCRRILWGWANESDTAQDDVKKGWAGIQTIPRTIWLDPNGKQLLQWPIDELNTLRAHKVEITNHELKQGDILEVHGITATQADVEVTFSFACLDKAEPFDPSWDKYDAQKLCSQKGSSVPGGLGPFGILTLASPKLDEHTPVFFRVFKAQDNKHVVLMCSDASRSSLAQGLYKPSFAGFVDVDLSNDKKISLRSLIDHSVVESFGAGGKTCITSRVYPNLAIYDNAHLHAFNNGTEPVKIETLEAWSMNNAKRN